MNDIKLELIKKQTFEHFKNYSIFCLVTLKIQKYVQFTHYFNTAYHVISGVPSKAVALEKCVILKFGSLSNVIRKQIPKTRVCIFFLSNWTSTT